MLIYKILRPAEWAKLDADGETTGAPIDVTDGYIHFSTAAQARETAAKHFAGAGDLVLAAVDTEPLGAEIKWEASRGGAEFPHLYRVLRTSDIAWTAPLPEQDGTHVFPDKMV